MAMKPCLYRIITFICLGRVLRLILSNVSNSFGTKVLGFCATAKNNLNTYVI